MAKRARTQKPLPRSSVGLRSSPAFSSDLEAFPAELLPGLPLAVTLWLEVPGAPVPVCFTTAEQAPGSEGVLADRIVFGRDELAALVVGVQSDRVWRKELLGMCFEKWRRPALRISEADALAGAQRDEHEQGWSLARVLDRLGAELVRVELAGEPREPRQPSRFPAAA
jgi:hypothetical protein